MAKEATSYIHKEGEKRDSPAVIISGFPGVGKSTLVSNPEDLIFLDSDSSNFSWNNKYKRERNPDWPNNYINHISENRDRADAILVSSHKEVRDALQNAGMEFVLVYPSLEIKDEYINRYITRGSDEQFIKLLRINYEAWIIELTTQQRCSHVVLQPGQYLSDVISEILGAKKL